MVNFLILDIWSTILTAFAIIGILDLTIIGIVVYALYRALAGLSAQERIVFIAFMIVIGFVLIISLIGAEIGVITVLAGVFSAVLFAIRPPKNKSE